MKNSFTNGKIVAKNYDGRLYVQQSARRGDPSYVMSRSELVDFAVCPSRWVNGYKEEDDTTSTEWGSLVDCLLFDPNLFKDRFAVKPATYTNDDGDDKPWNGNSKVCKEWMVNNQDRLCISAKTHDSSILASKRIQSDPQIGSVLNGADFQVYCTADYQDKDTGVVVPVKVLIDIVPHGAFDQALIDFKTARNADPSKWGRAVNAFGYDVQAALFLDVYNAASGEKRSEFRHICQENYPPFEISKPWLSDDFVRLGRTKYTEALRLYSRCIAAGRWSSYDDLQRDNYNGWSMVEPESYMVMNVKNPDPDWLSEPKEAE